VLAATRGSKDIKERGRLPDGCHENQKYKGSKDSSGTKGKACLNGYHQDEQYKGSKGSTAQLRIEEYHCDDDSQWGGDQSKDLTAELLQVVSIRCDEVVDESTGVCFSCI
jgi:hypothetical protein